MSMPGGIPSIKTSDLRSSFQAETNNSMVAETMEQYSLASTESAYENPGEQSTMGFMALGGDFQVSENISPWMDRKRSDFPSLTGTYNTNWDTAFVHMSVAEESILKETGRFNTPVECWG